MKEELLERMARGLREHHGGAEPRESDEQKAERLVTEELRRFRWDENDLARHRKTDATKTKIA